MDNPFDWDYLTTVPGPNEVWGGFSIAYVIVFGLLTVASIAMAAGWLRRFFDDPVLYTMMRKWANLALALSLVALFFFAIRWLQINPFDFGMRIWMWLCGLLLLVLIGYAIYDYATNYDRLKAEFEAKQVKERYLKHASTRTKHGTTAVAAPPPRPVRRRR